jgi:plasmid stabilization system protein ParE
MKLHFPWHVRQEARDAIDYYEAESAGLGEQLWLELESSVKWILANPTVPRLRPGDYRRLNLRTFPYYIAYAVRGDLVVLLAISHSARKPDYWTAP